MTTSLRPELGPVQRYRHTATDPEGDPLTYSWDVNGDGTFGDVT